MKRKQTILSVLTLAFGLLSCERPAERMTASLALQAEATTGEGAIWHPGRKALFWVDIEGKTLYEYRAGGESQKAWRFDRMVTTVVPESDTTMIVALQDRVIRLNLNDSTHVTIANVPDGAGDYRCNDGKCDPSGRLWIGTMGLKGQEKSATLFCLDHENRLLPKIEEVTISNGIVWSANKKYMYYNDTPTRKIARYRYNDATGEILFDGVAVKLPEGTGAPDGMTIDKDDNLWVAQWGGYGVYCYNPYTGELLKQIQVPAPNVASCAFGGENLDTLYITTARAGLTPEQLEEYPLSGSLFYCVPGDKGVRPAYFSNPGKK